MRLENKTALITGGGTGLGRAIAEKFAAEGCKVAITGRRAEPLEKTAGPLGDMAMPIVGDVSSPEDVTRMINEVVGKWGRLDILVNNAATITSRTPLVDTPIDAWDKMNDVNVKGVYLCCKTAIPVMIDQGGGSIINIASISGQRGQVSNSAYSTTKGAIMNLTRSVAVDYGPQQIRSNSISPGLVRTEMAEGRLGPSEDWDERSAREWLPAYPIGRIGMPEDIANGALFLASDEASWVSGIDLIMDGGMMAKL